MTLAILTVLACGPSGPSVLETPSWEGAPTRPAARATSTSFALSRHPEALVALEVPRSSRPSGEAAPEWFTAIAPFTVHKRHKKKDVVTWKSPLPVHSNLLSDKLKSTHTFGSGAPSDLRVTGPGGNMPWERHARRPGSFGFNRNSLLIGIPADQLPPEPEKVRMQLPRATEREDKLNHATSGMSERDFVLRNLTIDTTSHLGIYLPAPASATWSLTVPDGAVFSWRSTVIRPAIRDAVTSDGARILVEVVEGDAVTEVKTAAVTLDAWALHKVDLSSWAGKQIRLRLTTEPGESNLYDYVFLEGPTVYTPSDDPRRVVLLFVDTMRHDHLPFYGYERNTMPRLEKWARFGTVFDQARSVAPWTLPSVRATLTGAQPELWYETENLPERLARAGYATEGVIANAFLAQPFDMERGWDRYMYEHIEAAKPISDMAIEAIERHADRDLLLMVHYMDPHLPYQEPSAYRHMWAGPRPEALQSLTRRWLSGTVRRDLPEFQAIRDYVEDRYDQNLRFVDDHATRVLQAAGVDATVVLFSDHGEEFWEHNGFEHGHSFHDELLRVPVVMRGPGVPISRIEAPVSLLDITPTVLELEGIEHNAKQGTSLVPVLWSDEGAAAVLEARPQAFGRPLYLDDAWAVLAGGTKLIDRSGNRKVYDLKVDSNEARDIGAGTDRARFDELATSMATALDREVVLAWRLTITSGSALRDIDLVVTHPLGIESGWAGYDPRGRSAKSTVAAGDDGVLTVHQPRGAIMHGEVYAVPVGDPLDVLGLEAQFTGVGVALGGMVTDPAGRAVLSNTSTPFLRVGGAKPRVVFDLAYVPRPAGIAVSGYSDELEAELRELGYLD